MKGYMIHMNAANKKITPTFLERLLNAGKHCTLLALRVWVGFVFLQSGLTKIQSWETTIGLFDTVYAVPFLSSTMAAWIATATELFVPIVLMAGLWTRAAALALFTFNAVAVYSYPELSAAGIKDHQLWGLALWLLSVWGGGALTLDYLRLRKMHQRSA
jgi:putative oxidoreductase